MTLAQQYAQYIREARNAQLANDKEAVRSLERLLARTAADLRKAIRDTPRGIMGERYRRDLLASLNKTLDQFRGDYKELLDGGIIKAAKIVEARENKLLTATLAERDGGAAGSLFALPTTAKQIGAFSVRFAGVPQRTLEALYARTYKDGLRLSARLHNLDLAGRRAAADLVTEGIAKGQSARSMAQAIEPLISAGGTDNLRFKAMRIARTEINTAFREGHIASVTDDDGQLAPYISAIGWRLSGSHPRIDICDAWAGDDTEGLGPGNYSPGNVPSGHAHCLCHTVSLLVAMPEQQFIAHPAYPDDVPESQRRYYLNKE